MSSTFLQRSQAMPTPAMPKLPDPIRIPSPDDPDLLAARRRRMQEEFANRQGRDSTILTGGSGASQSADYTRTTLG